MAIGVNQVEYSPTSTTGWYAGISPPVSGYTVYVNKVTQGSSILVASNDNDLVSIARSQGATSTVTTTAGALNYFASQSDMMVVNKNYNNIVTSGLVLNVDASFVASYPVSGTSWYDISGSGNTGTLVNGPIFDTNGWIQFDGTNDQVNIPNNSSLQIIGDQTLEFIVYPERRDRRQNWYNKSYGGEGTITYETGGTMNYFWGTAGSNNQPYQGVGSGSPLSLATLNRWYHVVLVRELSTPTKTVKWYINGSLNVTVTASYTAATASSSQITLGNGYTNPFLGRLPVTRQYNIALSSSQVLQNYYGGPIVTSGLTLAVDAGNLVSFQNGSGSTFSLVGSYTGTLTNGVSYTTGNGGGWVFDGTNDYITLGTQNFISSDFTLNIWFNTSTNSVKEHYLFSFGYNNTNSLVIAIDTQVVSGFASMSAYYNVGGVVTGRLITSSNFPNTNTIHFSFTRNSGINTCYINGVPQTSRIFTESVSFGSFVYDIGWATQRNKSTAYFQGNIYTTYIYNRALSAAEVAQNFNAQKRRFGF
jgi:hypothetical protein